MEKLPQQSIASIWTDLIIAIHSQVEGCTGTPIPAQEINGIHEDLGVFFVLFYYHDWDACRV